MNPRPTAAKPSSDSAGNGLHIHLSLHDVGGRNVFADPRAAEGLSPSAGPGWYLVPLEEPASRGPTAIVDGNSIRVVDGSVELLPTTDIHTDCVVLDAVVSGDASRVFAIGFPDHLHVFPLVEEPRPGPGLDTPAPSDGWLRRGGVGAVATIEGQLPSLGGAPPEGPVRVRTAARLGHAPVFEVEVAPGADGRFAVEVPYGEVAHSLHQVDAQAFFRAQVGQRRDRCFHPQHAPAVVGFQLGEKHALAPLAVFDVKFKADDERLVDLQFVQAEHVIADF